MTITIADLRHRLRIEVADHVPDGGGGNSRNWTLETEVWGAIRSLSGSQPFGRDGLSGEIRHEVWVRFRAGLGPDKRFVAGARVLEIRAVLDPDGERRWLRCLCREVVA